METIIQYKVKEDIPDLFLKKGMILTRYPNNAPEMTPEEVAGKFYNNLIMYFWVENTPELFELYTANSNATEKQETTPNVVLSNSIPGDVFKGMFPEELRKERYSKYTKYWDGVIT